MYGTRITTVPRVWIAQSQLIFHIYSHSYFADLRAYPSGKWIVQGTKLKHMQGSLQKSEAQSSCLRTDPHLQLVWQGSVWSLSFLSPGGFTCPRHPVGLQRHHSLFLDSVDRTDSDLFRGYAPGRTQAKIYQEGGPQGGFHHPHLQWLVLDPEICLQDEPPEQTEAVPAGSCAHSKRLCRQISVSKHIPTFPL